MCVLVVMRSVSLGEDYILKVVSGAGLTCKLLCTLSLSHWYFGESWRINFATDQVDYVSHRKQESTKNKNRAI